MALWNPGIEMRRLNCFIAMVGLALVAAGPAAFAQEALPDAFDGKFRGTLSGTSGETSGEFTVTIKKSDGGFMVNWPPRIVAQFEPTGHPGVFKTREKSQVLEGNPVYWARIEEGTLIVYSAQIGKHGGYRVDNFIYTPSGDGLDLVVRRVVTGAEPQISSGKLNRYGG